MTSTKLAETNESSLSMDFDTRISEFGRRVWSWRHVIQESTSISGSSPLRHSPGRTFRELLSRSEELIDVVSRSDKPAPGGEGDCEYRMALISSNKIRNDGRVGLFRRVRQLIIEKMSTAFPDLSRDVSKADVNAS